MRQVLAGTATYGAVKIQPMLMLAKGAVNEEEMAPQPVKTVPSHFSQVYDADRADFERVFGVEDETHFEIGEKGEDMNVPVCLDLKRFVQRSNGVFGKSGTGKSFLSQAAALRSDQEQLGGQPHLRHAQRIRAR